MIVVKVELHSAITGRVTEIGRCHITNTGEGSATRGDYTVELMRRGTVDRVQRLGAVQDYPRLTYSVWVLVARALASVGLCKAEALPAREDVFELVRMTLARVEAEIAPPAECIFCDPNPCADCLSKARLQGTLGASLRTTLLAMGGK